MDDQKIPDNLPVSPVVPPPPPSAPLPPAALSVTPALRPEPTPAPIPPPPSPSPQEIPPATPNAPEPANERPVIPAVPPAAPEARPGSVVRTYESDIANAMREKKGSVVKIALAEHERRVREEEPERAAPRRRWTTTLSLILVTGGIGVLAAAYLLDGWGGGGTGAKAPAAPRSIVPAETQKPIALQGLSPAKLKELLRAEIAREDFRLDTIEQIYFTKMDGGAETLAPTEEFFRLASSRIPSVLLRSLRPEFMYGIHAFNGNEPFLILKTDFYENAFLGLLRWEPAMATDLFALFAIPLDDVHRPLLDKPFQDAVLKNQDARVLLNDRGGIVILYAIPNRETVIITTSADTLSELVRRLGAPQGSGR